MKKYVQRILFRISIGIAFKSVYRSLYTVVIKQLSEAMRMVNVRGVYLRLVVNVAKCFSVFSFFFINGKGNQFILIAHTKNREKTISFHALNDNSNRCFFATTCSTSAFLSEIEKNFYSRS